MTVSKTTRTAGSRPRKRYFVPPVLLRPTKANRRRALPRFGRRLLLPLLSADEERRSLSKRCRGSAEAAGTDESRTYKQDILAHNAKLKVTLEVDGD